MQSEKESSRKPKKLPEHVLHLNGLMRRHQRRVIAVIITLLWLTILFIASLIFFPNRDYNEQITFQAGAPPSSLSGELPSPLPEIPLETEISAMPIVPAGPPVEKIKVKSGENLSSIFLRLHLSPQELAKILKLPLVKNAARRLRVGQELEFVITNNQLQELTIPISSTEDLEIKKIDLGFVANSVPHEMTITSTKFGSVTVHTSLYIDGEHAGIPMKVLVGVATIFNSAFDFTREIHPGDHVGVVYQELKDTKIGTFQPGAILSAAFTHLGKTYYAFRFVDSNGNVAYYNEKGESLRRAFNRRPITIGRISSPFNLHRLHPILGYVRPHTGTDFAAPYGTPIHATADGRIAFIGRKGGYGRVIVINHGHGITTLYGHMSRFARSEYVGIAVKINQVIGYIGMSGLASGPHVHYEYRINDQYQDPMKVILPNAAPVPSVQKAAFAELVKKEISEMDIPKTVVPTVSANSSPAPA
ncbi:MAG: M23 family metallopeptidase [Gammaproteobacteria bacterium]|nr:M23 family metallopeptidase [Gammaproteobacteria bacterium]